MQKCNEDSNQKKKKPNKNKSIERTKLQGMNKLKQKTSKQTDKSGSYQTKKQASNSKTQSR